MRRERSVLMQEVVELQQQQRTTVQQAREVNQRLQSAELRQKQMVSFLAKFVKNPTLLAANKLEKEQGVIDSPRVRRKFVKHHQHQTGTSGSLEVEGQIVRYPQYLSLDLTRELNEGSSSIGLEDPLLKGKNVMSINQEQVTEEYLVSFPDDLAKETGLPDFPSLGTESFDTWNTNFNVSGSGFSSVNDSWRNHTSYEVPGFGVTNGISDLWDLSSLHALGNLPSNEYPHGQPKDNRNKNLGP